jgi:Protein of unknown function (DUF1572)
MESAYLDSVKEQFEMYKMLGEKAIAQVPDDKLFWQFNNDSNSIATIAKHLAGNMLSRWTDFLTTDGEKEWRNREAEFDNDINSRVALMDLWNKGWACLFNALNQLTDADLEKIVYIRNMGHTVMEAINRQLTHYPYHIGQIVFTAKMICGEKWISLSIPRGESKKYNDGKFSKPKHKEHFADEFLKNNNA